jgi:hypothetical protein
MTAMDRFARKLNDQPKLTVTPRIALANTAKTCFSLLALRQNPAEIERTVARDVYAISADAVPVTAQIFAECWAK